MLARVLQLAPENCWRARGRREKKISVDCFRAVCAVALLSSLETEMQLGIPLGSELRREAIALSRARTSMRRSAVVSTGRMVAVGVLVRLVDRRRIRQRFGRRAMMHRASNGHPAPIHSCQPRDEKEKD